MTNNEAPRLEALLGVLRRRANDALARCLPAAEVEPRRLHDAMRYAVLNGGKRVRAVLVYTSAQAVHAPDAFLDAPACAVELIHAYSLVHDDLPMMDDDDLRRGKPACHRAFDEATALLAGDALQSQAFLMLSGYDGVPAHCRAAMVEVLARAAGSRGMAGGQAIDLDAVGKRLDLAELECMHLHKTGALIRASVRLGAIAHPDIDAKLLDDLDIYARCIGLAFQIRDDVLDVEGDTRTLGKARGSDEAKNKPTYPALLGLDGAKRMAHRLHDEALAALAALGESADPLRWISAYIVTRSS